MTDQSTICRFKLDCQRCSEVGLEICTRSILETCYKSRNVIELSAELLCSVLDSIITSATLSKGLSVGLDNLLDALFICHLA